MSNSELSECPTSHRGENSRIVNRGGARRSELKLAFRPPPPFTREFVFASPSEVCPLTLIRLQDLFPQADRARGNFHVLIVADELDGLFQIQDPRRHQPD